MKNAQQRRSSAVNVLIAEADSMNCQLIERALCRKRNGVVVVGSATDSSQALALLKERHPDVVIVSARLRKGPLEGYHFLRELRDSKTSLPAIMLLDSRDPKFVIDAFRCGARGVIFRDEPLETLGKCIHAVHQGQVWANSQQLRDLLESFSHASPFPLNEGLGMGLLSNREQDVARLISEGLTNRQISARLFLSEHTVRNYLIRIFQKLGVSTRVELVLCLLQEKHRSAASQGA